MSARRLSIALVFAIAISGLFTFWLSKRYAKQHRSSTSDHLRYVATTKKLEAGEVLDATQVKLVDWPSSMPMEGSFTKPEDVIGRTVLYPLASGEPVLDRQISAPGMGPGLATKIPDGMRAISLKSDQVVGVSGFLLPGTHVDVLVTFHTATSPNPVTATVLQDAQVIAAGQKMQPDPEGKASTVDVVTLLVSPEDAEKVTLASSQGSVRFALRNGSDHNHLANQPTDLSALGEVAAEKPAPKPVERPRAAAPTYTVEIMRGSKHSVESFQ